MKCGSFSHINQAIEQQLGRVYSDRVMHVIDIRDLIKSSPLAAGCAILSVLRWDGLGRTVKRCDLLDSMIQSPFLFKWIKSQLSGRIRRLDCEFSIQTQSMWDGSAEGIPNFIYTDHTQLANLSYPGFDRADLCQDWWLEHEARIYRNAEKIFTMSGHVTRSLVDDYSIQPSRIECIYAGANAETSNRSVSNSTGTVGGRPLILFVGVEWERKGGPALIAAFEEVKKVIPDAGLRIVGCSPSVDMDGCEVLGRRPLEELPEHYAKASVFCLPTRVEPFGIAFVEAMHAGLPIVGTDLGGVPDMVTNGTNGYRVPVDDVGALASALIKIVGDPSNAERMGIESRRMAEERYSWDSVGDRLRDSIELSL